MSGEIGGLHVFWHQQRKAPIVYLHGVPTDADDWLPFLERTGGAAPDLPGFGRSAKPASFPYGIEGYDRFLESFADELGFERFSLVMHDWGAAGLAFARRRPERIDKLVLINAVPLLDGYRWHRVARAWRLPLVGELTMGVTTKWGMKRGSKEWTQGEGPAPQEMLDRVWERFDHGTQRAILKLYRSAPERVLAAAEQGLGEIGRPSLVVWGGGDPFIPDEFARRYAEVLGGRLLEVEGARHWPWVGRPEVVEQVAQFLQSD